MTLGFDFRRFIHLRFYNKIFKFKPAFTLAEVLITLAIIGIVAALTIPTLIKDFQAKQYEVKFKQAYSLITNAVGNLHSQGIWIYGQRWLGANKYIVDNLGGKNKSFIFIFASAFKGLYSEDSSDAYFTMLFGFKRGTGGAYKTFLGKKDFNGTLYDDGMFQLNNGMTIMLQTGAFVYSPIIIVDLNGIYHAPNRFGLDTFAFIIGENDIVYPLGHPKCGEYNDADLYCNYNSDDITNSNGNANGYTCAYKAMTIKDYFKNLPK